jgi:uncharacterized protein (TIGR02569 family)
MDPSRRSAPPADVIRSFGLEGPPEPLTGGRGRSWRVGTGVLKPVDVPAAQLAWQAALLDELRGSDRFRVPLAIRTQEGALEVDGWGAMTFLHGRHRPRRWTDVIAAGTAFHEATAGVPRPAFLSDRDDPWAIADRAAWGEISMDEVPETKHLERLASHLRPVDASSQLVHGDLTDNVLFEDGRPPAIIDLAPYFRPVAFATAVVVIDAITWEGAGDSLITEFADLPDFTQHLLRALIYRIVTDRLFRLDQPLRRDDEDPHLSAVERILVRTTR